MSTTAVEELLTKGGADRTFRMKYDTAPTKEEFVKCAAEDGFEFTVEELMAVINDAGDTFDSYGNPPKRSIWW